MAALPPNIPPDENVFSGVITSILKNAFKFIQMQGHLLIPCAIAAFQGVIQAKDIATYDEHSNAGLNAKLRQYELELSQLRDKYDTAMQDLKRVTSDTTSSQLDKFLAQESEVQQKYLATLSQVEMGIQAVLSIKCSTWASKQGRLPIQERLYEISPEEFHPGLTHIFDSSAYCSDRFLWTLWVDLWKNKIEARKYQSAIERLKRSRKSSFTDSFKEEV